MNNKLSYEEFCNKYLHPVELDEALINEMQQSHGIDVRAEYERARRAEYQDYLER